MPPVGSPLSNGTVRSSWVPTTAGVASHAVEPTLFRTPDRFVFVTSFGNYSFLAGSPYVMEYNDTEGMPMVTWSAFLVGVSTGGLPLPMVPTNATVTGVTNSTFQSTYTPTYLGIEQGTVQLSASFSAYSPPKFAADFLQANTSGVLFNIFWDVVPTLTYLRESSTGTLSLGSVNPESWVASPNLTAVLGATSNVPSWQDALIMNWSDAEGGDLYAGPLAPLGTDLGDGLTVMFPVNQATVDPTVVGTFSSAFPTAYSSERKTFFYDGFFWAFYDTGSGIRVKSSPDGNTWTNASDPATGTISKGFDVAQRGSTIVIAWVNSASTALYSEVGALVKGAVNWNPSAAVYTFPSSAVGPVGVAVDRDGNIWVAADIYYSPASAYYRLVFESVAPTASQFALAYGSPVAANNQLEVNIPVAMPNGNVALLWADEGSNALNWVLWSSGVWGASQSKTTDLATWGESYTWVSAIAMPNGDIWAAYPSVSGTMGGVGLLFIPAVGFASWGDVIPYGNLAPQYPALGTDDYGDAYLFYFINNFPNYYLDYAVYTQARGTWTAPAVLLLNSYNGFWPLYLTSAAHVANQAFLIFSQPVGANGPTFVEFVSMPLPINLGTSPSQPWARDGLSPYGTYFQQLSDYVAPGSGLLTVVQSDVKLPGRGLNLAISRVYSTPRTFLATSGAPTPYLYESYIGANLGSGWSLDFPWMGNELLHMWNGQSYLIRWDGNGVFENHAGEQFELIQLHGGRFGHLIGYQLLLSDGTSYQFDVYGQLSNITDYSGQNSILFSYGSNGISSITDTVGRMVNFAYDGNGRLQSLTWAGRTVQYSYDSQGQLVQVLDPLGRATTFSYNPTNAWLLSGVTYPTGGRTAYSYRTASLGTEATTNLVSLQNVYNGSSLVKSTSFSYDVVNGNVPYTRMTISNGSAVQGFTTNNFGCPRNGMTTTVFDATGRQERKVVVFYTANGLASQEDVYTGNGASKTYSTYQALDNWGNIIYTRDAVGQETFSSYANTDHANVFSSPGMLSTTSSGLIMSSNFDNRSLSDWSVNSAGGSAGWVGLNNSADPMSAPSLEIMTNTSTSTVSWARRYFPAQAGTFVAEGRVRADPNSHQVFLLLMTTAGAFSVYFAFLDGLQGGTMGWSSDGYAYTYCGSYVPSEWYHIAFEVNVPAGTYNIWINGGEACVGARLRSSAPISSLQVQAGYVNDGSIVTWGDDFKVYTSRTLSVNGVPSGSEVEATDAYGTVVAAATVLSGSSTATLNTLAVNAHDYSLNVYNTTQPVRNGNMETQAAWSYVSSIATSSEGYDTALFHSGVQSYSISLNGGTLVAGDYAETYQDIAAFPPNGPLRLWYNFAPLSGNGLCSASSNPAYLTVRLSTATYGSSANMVDLATAAVNVFASSTGWSQLTGIPSGTSFRLYLRVIVQSGLTNCFVAVHFDDVDGPSEYSSPVMAFGGGEVDSYTPPVWRSGEFYLNAVPWTIHDRIAGSLSWPNGSLDPSLYFDMSTYQTPSRTDLLRDLSGHGNAASISGTTATTGIAGGAQSFSGSAYLTVSDSASLNLRSTLTFVAWAYPTSLVLNTNYEIVRKIAWTPTRGYLFRLQGDATNVGHLNVEIWNGSSKSAWNSNGGIIGINMWQMAAFTLSGGTGQFYLNGAPVTTTEITIGPASPQNTGSPLFVGASEGPAEWFVGTIDEVRIYNRALSSSEIRQLATQILWYDMETFPSPGLLEDMSEYQNAGTVTGTNQVGGKVGKALNFNGVGDTVTLSMPAVNTSSGATTTVAFWMYWNGGNGQMPFGFNLYDIDLANGYFGFNTGNGDIYGMSSSGLANTWVYVVAEFYNGDATKSTLYINGIQQALSQKLGTQRSANAYATASARVSGWYYSTAYKFGGVIDEVHVYRRALSTNDVAGLATPRTTPPSRSFFQSNSIGETVEARTYHNASWLYTDQTFDTYGNVLTRTDANGQVTTYGYSSTYQSAYLTSVSRGSTTRTYAYDFAAGLLTSATDPKTYTTNYAYDLLGRTTSIVRPLAGGVNPTTTYVYDDAHDTVTVYDPDSMPRLFHYDMETLVNGTLEDLSGHGNFGTLYGTTSVTGKVGLARSFNGTGARIQAPHVNVGTTFSASVWVNPTSGQTDGEGVLIKEDSTFSITLTSSRVVNAYIYNGASWQVVSSNSSLAAGSWTHVVVTYAQAGSNTATYVYLNGAKSNAKTLTGQAASSSNPLMLGALTSTFQRLYGSEDEAQILGVSLSASQITSLYQGTQGGRYLKTYYDGIGREVRSVQRSFFSGPSTSDYHQETFVNTWQDSVGTYTNANGTGYRTVYDFLGRPTTVTNPDSSARTTAYDDTNRIVTMTDEAGRETQDVYDVAGRLVSVRQYTSPSTYVATTNAYDLSGELVAAADPLRQTTHHAYDDAGRLAQTLYPDGTDESYVYDNVGNVIAKTDRAGRTVRYAYDALYRMTSAAYPGGSVLTYSYDNNGNVRSVLNGTASVYFYYDALNRITTRSLFVSGDSTNYSVSYGYDGAGNLLTLTYPDSQGTLTYTYDAFYRVTSMTFAGTSVATFTYRKDDLLSTISYGDGSLATYVFNGRGFPLEDKVSAGSTTLMDLAYTENATGDVVGIKNKAVGGDTESYVYDKLDRITSASGPWGTITYGYDAAGNRINMSLAGTWTHYAYGVYNKLCASSSASVSCSSTGSSVTKYYYDANGNIVNRVLGSTNNSYAFDVDNRLVKALAGGSTYTFSYDGLGDRVRETGPSGTKTYNYTYVASGDAMLYLKNVVGTTTTKTVYLYAGSLLVASVSGTTYSYFHEDHLGDTRLVTQKPHSSVVVVFSTNYQPFGVQYAPSGTDPSVKYTGQWSEAVGLYYNHARYYDPTLGRFVSQDPVLGHLSAPQTLNRYGYAVNNPMRFEDPSGRDPLVLFGAIIGAVVGYVGCGLATGNWISAQCGEAALAGAIVGALAGLTFGASLALAGTAGLGTATATGGFAFAGASGLAAFTFAGATSGAIAGAAGYFASGGIALANGQQWSFSSRNFINSVGSGIIVGAAAGAAGYGLNAGIGRLSEWWSSTGDSNPATFWDRGTFDSPEDSLAYHWAQHAEQYGISPEQYTRDALAFRDANWGNPDIEQGPWGISGGRVGWKFWSQPGGIFTQEGKIVSYWYD